MRLEAGQYYGRFGYIASLVKGSSRHLMHKNIFISAFVSFSADAEKFPCFGLSVCLRMSGNRVESVATGGLAWICVHLKSWHVFIDALPGLSNLLRDQKKLHVILFISSIWILPVIFIQLRERNYGGRRRAHRTSPLRKEFPKIPQHRSCKKKKKKKKPCSLKTVHKNTDTQDADRETDRHTLISAIITPWMTLGKLLSLKLSS